MNCKSLEPIAPGEILREEFMRPVGLGIDALARNIGVSRKRMSEIVNAERAISADTARRLGAYFGVSPQIWLDLQSDYDARFVRVRLKRRGRLIVAVPHSPVPTLTHATVERTRARLRKERARGE